MPSATTAATSPTDDRRRRWCCGDARSRTCSAVPARRPRRVPPRSARLQRSAVHRRGTACPRARSAVGATSISWAKGARPVLGELSQAGAGKPGPRPSRVQLGAAVVDPGDPGQDQQRVARQRARDRGAQPPTSADLGQRLRPQSRFGAVVGLAPARRRRSAGRARRARAGRRQQAADPRPPTAGCPRGDPQLGRDGERRGPSRHCGAADAGPQGAGSAPNRAVPSSAAVRCTTAAGSASATRGPLLEAAGPAWCPGQAPARPRGRWAGAAGSPRGARSAGAPGQTSSGPARGRGCRRRGRPAVEQAGRRAGRAHRHSADRGLLGQGPQLRGGLRIDVGPGPLGTPTTRTRSASACAPARSSAAPATGSGPASNPATRASSAAARRSRVIGVVWAEQLPVEVHELPGRARLVRPRRA